MTATPLKAAPGTRRSANRQRTSSMPLWQPELRPLHQAVPLHRVLPPRSMVLLAGLAMLLIAVLVVAGR
jgi:hypothetical protein